MKGRSISTVSLFGYVGHLGESVLGVFQVNVTFNRSQIHLLSGSSIAPAMPW